MAHRKVALALLFFALGAGSSLVAADTPNPIGFPKGEDPGGGVGVFRIWYEDGEWHLRTSTENSKGKKDQLLIFTGSVRCDGQMKVEGKKVDKGNGKTSDKLIPSKDGKGFDIDFRTYGGIDEAIFKVTDNTKKITFKLLLNGEKVSPLRIMIGEKGECPDKNEFTLPAHPKK